jgi:hypothetical protein
MANARKPAIEPVAPIINDVFNAHDDFFCGMQRLETLYEEIASIAWESLPNEQVATAPIYRVAMLLTLANEKLADLRLTFGAIDDADTRSAAGGAA